MIRTAGDVERIVLAHGGGGELTTRLIREQFLPSLGVSGRVADGDRLSIARGDLSDAAVLAWDADEVVFTTDSFVVTPIEFPGGDIGRLAVAGTVNDLSVMGAEPIALSLGLILEEGLPVPVLKRIIESIRATAEEAGVEIVTGDTKVIERRGQAEPGLLINTAGIGRRLAGPRPDASRIRPGDAVLVSGPLGEHGLAIMSVRNGLEFETAIRSDAAPLNQMVARLLGSGANVRFLRDATRGGVAGVLADLCEEAGLSVEIDEQRLPLTATVRHAAEMLGLDPLTVANEGKLVCIVDGADRDTALPALRADPYGRHATCIGSIRESQPPLVELVTRSGGRRVVQRPYGEELPRIC